MSNHVASPPLAASGEFVYLIGERSSQDDYVVFVESLGQVWGRGERGERQS